MDAHGMFSTSTSDGDRVTIRPLHDGSLELAIGPDTWTVNPLDAACIGDMLVTVSLNLGRPVPPGLLAMAVERGRTGPLPPYAPHCFGSRTHVDVVESWKRDQ